MKLNLSIKLLIVFLILQQITCASSEGPVLVKNLTSLTSQGVYNLGFYFFGDKSITVKSLIGTACTLDIYHQRSTYDGKLSRISNKIQIQPFETKIIPVSNSDQKYYLSFEEELIPKLAIEIKNPDGTVLNSIDQFAYGTETSGAIRYITFKNDCAFSVDRTTFSAPFMTANHPVLVATFDVDGKEKTEFPNVLIGPTNSFQSNVLAGESALIVIDANENRVDASTFAYGIPIYSPSDNKCQIEQRYFCTGQVGVPGEVACPIFNGFKCGGANNMQCVPDCGDKVVVEGEQCDGTEGCSQDCKILCGNEKIDGTEECDNGNKEGCVGCKIVQGYKCPLVDSKSACSLICQTNKILEDGEDCDNGGKAGCTNCKIVSPYKCKNTLGKPSLCYICGNSIYQQGEECDNGNKTGCINCTLDRGFTCVRKLNTISNCTNICGDGLWVDGEECDNGNQTGCINCVITPKYTCRGPKYTTSKCISCGNFIVEWPQQCDNNNVNGCKNCIIQTGWNCRANPKYCYRVAQVCGNGEREIEEDCDDGNKVNGDGCSSLCKKESGYTCSEALGEKTTCSKVTR